MIYFLANTLDGQDGASRSGADALSHLVQLGRPVTVVSRNRCALPRSATGTGAQPVRWVTTPTPLPDPRTLGASVGRWAAWTRTIAKLLWRRLVAASVTHRHRPTLAIHNAFPVPGTYTHRLFHRAPRRMLIVHSAPDVVMSFLRRSRSLTLAGVATDLERTDALAFVSPQVRDAWAATADIARVPQWILPNTCREDAAAGLVGADRRQLRERLDLPPDAFLAACVGYVGEGKGQDVLVEALPSMARTTPNVLVMVAGNDRSEFAAQLRGRIETLQLAGRVRFMGQRPDPYALIRAADLLVHPSRSEGQGLVILEAMLLGTPILASDVGGIPSCITHGESGWLVRPNDPRALADAFDRLASDAALRDRLARRAAEVYAERFSRREYAKRFEAMFRHFGF